MQPVPQRYVCIVGTCFMDIPSQIGSSGGTICSLDIIDAYMSQLQQYNAIATCDDSLRLFVVQDFFLESLSLKVMVLILFVIIMLLFLLSASVLFCVPVSAAIC